MERGRTLPSLVVVLALAGGVVACGGGAAPIPEGLFEGITPEDVAQGEEVTPVIVDVQELAGPPDGWEDGAVCEESSARCMNLNVVEMCAYGKWVLNSVCLGDDICLLGHCVPQEACTPGDVKGCYAFDARAVCNDTGLAYVPEPCGEGLHCVLDGKCRPTKCTPKFGVCMDLTHYLTCRDDGSGYDYPAECPEGQQCIGGECRSMCESEVKTSSYVGCEYWTVDLHNWDQKDVALSPPADIIPHAVVISNPGVKPVVVKFETQASGYTLTYSQAELTIPPGELKVYTMPVMSQNGTHINNLSIRITATHPITAHQFNPLNNVGVASNDASLLLPANVLGTEYIVVSYPTGYAPGIAGMSSITYSGFATVVATSEGDTVVNIVRAAGQIEAGTYSDTGEVIPAVKQGKSATFTLKQYEVLNIEADHMEGLSTYEYDLTGTIIQTSKPVAVFGGHECAVVAPPGKSCCCCDHMEEQLIPLYAWGTDYHAIKVNPRGGTSDEDYWLILSGQDGVTVHTNPPIAGIDGVKLDKGKFKYFSTSQSYEVTSDGPISVNNIMMSQECTTKGNGDPSLTVIPAVNQYRKDYAILTPDKYAEDWVTVIRPLDLPVTLDGSLITESFTPFGTGLYEYGYVAMQPGSHHFSGGMEFGVIAYGFDAAVSYGYPGGMNLIGTKPSVNP